MEFNSSVGPPCLSHFQNISLGNQDLKLSVKKPGLTSYSQGKGKLGIKFVYKNHKNHTNTTSKEDNSQDIFDGRLPLMQEDLQREKMKFLNQKLLKVEFENEDHVMSLCLNIIVCNCRKLGTAFLELFIYFFKLTFTQIK